MMFLAPAEYGVKLASLAQDGQSQAALASLFAYLLSAPLDCHIDANDDCHITRLDMVTALL
jgi:hypothetical protein